MTQMTEDELLILLAAIEKTNLEKMQEEMEEARAWNQG